MHDYESADWARHHDQVSSAVQRLFGDILTAFQRLQHIQFDAPWNRPAK